MKRCPHEQVQFCPLYVAGHVVGLPTCMGQWDFEGCDVDHGREEYEELVAQLFRHDPAMVADRALAEERFERAEQRKRNMRAACVRQ